MNKSYSITGISLIVVGFIMNPWSIHWLSGSGFSTIIFVALLAVSIALIVVGWGIIYKKKKFFSWLSATYRDTAVILLNLFILFGVLNVIAALLIKPPSVNKVDSSYFYDPQYLFTDSINFIRNIYPGKSDEDIHELLLSSPYANHPVLEFQEKIQQSKYYNTGFEGIRFDQKVTKSNADQKINGAIWVFGGSTTFGQGVSDDETISACLNRIDTANTYINFGVHAYHQSDEIEKLLLLLKKGYLPKKVIFIDGLNDFIRMVETNFHPLETPALAKSAFTSDYNIATSHTGNSFLRRLPVTRWLRLVVDKKKFSKAHELPWDKYDNIYDPENLYNTDPKQYYQATILRSPYKLIDVKGLNYIIWKLKVFYSANYKFISKIAEAFDFEFSVYYQPIGVLAKDNPFWSNQATGMQSPLYSNFSFVVPKLRMQFVEWDLDHFYDISDIQDLCPDCYVDLTHYNPELCRMIAIEITKIESGNEQLE